MKFLFSFLVSLCLIVTSPAYSDDADTTITIGEKHSVFSQILNEDRPYWVSLPEGYSKEQKYPVVYMLDGNGHFYYTAGMLRKMSRGAGSIPQMILVAIPNTNRTRDLTPTNVTVDFDENPEPRLKDSGGADKFLKFITDELDPKIKVTYKTQPYRMLIGHSFGGLFALHSSLSKPDFFKSMIVIDPSIWWDNKVMISRLKEQLASLPKTPLALYMSAANNVGRDGDTMMIDPQREYTAILSAWKSDTFKNTLQFYEKENHGSVPLPSLYNGLKYIFEGYAVNRSKVFEDPRYLVAHYKTVSKQMGFRIKPPSETMGQLAGYFIGEEKYELALEALAIYVEIYPTMAEPHIGYGEVYKALGKIDLARKSYDTALKLDPENKQIKEKLAGLTQ